jgi:hypothetical protein
MPSWKACFWQLFELLYVVIAGQNSKLNSSHTYSEASVLFKTHQKRIVKTHGE